MLHGLLRRCGEEENRLGEVISKITRISNDAEVVFADLVDERRTLTINQPMLTVRLGQTILRDKVQGPTTSQWTSPSSLYYLPTYCSTAHHPRLKLC